MMMVMMINTIVDFLLGVSGDGDGGGADCAGSDDTNKTTKRIPLSVWGWTILHNTNQLIEIEL